jgi:hypothetical protein
MGFPLEICNFLEGRITGITTVIGPDFQKSIGIVIGDQFPLIIIRGHRRNEVFVDTN